MSQEQQRTSARPGDRATGQFGGNGAMAGKYLSFHLGAEEYAIPVLKVMEIIGLQDITPVPQTPSYVRGVMNLRGKIAPVFDLRLKFRLPEAPYTQRTCIIVVQTASESGPVGVGLIVDAVSEVVQLAASEIENAADLGLRVDLPYLLGIAKTKDRVRMIVSIDELLSHQDVSIADQAMDIPALAHV